MYKNLTKIPTVNMSREEWLAERQNSLGGSDVASILGMNEWRSAYATWAEKTGLLPIEAKDNEAMRTGRDLEQYVAERFCEATGKKVRKENNIIRNPEFPFMHANVDRVVVGEDAVLECKTVSAWNEKAYRNGQYPDRFYAQCVAYMAVCGFKKAYLAVLIMGRDFKVFEIERDEAEIEALKTACKDFWQLVQTKTPPAADGSQSTTDAINTAFPDGDPGLYCDLMSFEEIFDRIEAIKAEEDKLDSEKTELQNQIKAFMEEATEGASANYKVTWKPTVRKTFDAKALQAAYPDTDFDRFYKTSSSRTFLIKRKKAEK